MTCYESSSSPHGHICRAAGTPGKVFVVTSALSSSIGQGPGEPIWFGDDKGLRRRAAARLSLTADDPVNRRRRPERVVALKRLGLEGPADRSQSSNKGTSDACESGS
jgi:hypothetical protein